MPEVQKVIAETLRMWPAPPLLIRCATEVRGPRAAPASTAARSSRARTTSSSRCTTWGGRRSCGRTHVFDPQRWDRPFTNPEVKGWAGYDPDKRTGINIEQGGLWVANLEIATDHAMLPFGAGARKRVGDQFALLEAAVSVVMLLRRFEFELSMDPVYPEKFDDNNPDKSIGMVGMKAAATIHTATGLFCKVKERFPGETDLPPLQAPVREKKKRAADEPQEVLV